MSATIASILARKGSEVVRVAPSTSVEEAVRLLEERNIGALLVSDEGREVAGIVSERDVIRHLARAGPGALDGRIDAIMTARVHTCDGASTTAEVMRLMTVHRIRHVPVVDGSDLVGLVSIRDVVESYVDELEVTTEALAEYVTGSAY